MDIYNTRSGINQNDASTYTIIKLYSAVQYEQADEQPNATPNAQAGEQADEQAGEHIITKLNLLFNYIYNKYNAREEEFGLTEKNRSGLIETLKRLDLYTENTEIYDVMPTDYLLDQKIMIWAIKDIYLSPHKIFLNGLTKEKLNFIYLKSKRYITKKENYKLEEIISYFIVCLHEEFEKESKMKVV